MQVKVITKAHSRTGQIETKVTHTGAFRRNDHRLRVRYESEGVALLSSGSYAVKRINVEEAERLKDVSAKRITTSGLESYLLVHGDGTLIRKVIADRKEGLFTVNDHVGSIKLFPQGHAELLSRKQLLDKLRAEGWSAKLHIKSSGKTYSGIALGARDKTYASLVCPSPKGGLIIKDIETRRNIHNADVVGSLTEVDKHKNSAMRELLAA